MKRVYLDTNIFVYATDPNSIFNKECLRLIDYCQKNQIGVTTSAETIQEIIHLSINTKKMKQGIETAKIILKSIDDLYIVDKAVIEIYLKLVETYPTSTSRDLLHVSSCIANKVDTLITYDNDYRKFKEVKTVNPTDYLSGHRPPND